MPNLSDRATGLTNVNVISLNELSASPSDPAAGQKRLYAKDDGKVYTLDSDGNEKEVGSGGGASVEVAQSGHGFIIGDVLYFDGTNYAKAKADAANTAEVVGIVSEVVDIDNFVATTAGYVESGLELDVDGDPLVAGSVYFLSASTAGGLTLNEPNVVGQVSRPVLLVSAARTAEGAADAKGFVLPYRGVVVGGSNARTSLSLNNNGSTNIQDMSDYDAGELSGWIYIKAGVADADSLRFYVEAQVSRNGVGDDYNISYQTSGDTPPSGFDMNVSSAGMVSVVLPDVSGFSSANINYSLNAAAVGVDLPLSISGENILEATSSVRGTVKKNRVLYKADSTSRSGPFSSDLLTISNLPAGKYRATVGARGFRQSPNASARINPKLNGAELNIPSGASWIVGPITTTSLTGEQMNLYGVSSTRIIDVPTDGSSFTLGIDVTDSDDFVDRPYYILEKLENYEEITTEWD